MINLHVSRYQVCTCSPEFVGAINLEIIANKHIEGSRKEQDYQRKEYTWRKGLE